MFVLPVIRLTTARRSDVEASVRLSKRRAWFADESDAGATPDTENPSEESGENKGKPTVTYTKEQQAHIDSLAREQREQARRAERAELLKKFGAEKPEDIEAKLKELDDLKKSQMTEQEKKDAELTSEKSKREAAEAKLAAYEARQALDARNSAIKAAAKDMPTPEDAVSWLRDNAPADLDALKADANGKYDEKALKALVDKVRAARPAWFKPSSPGSPSVSGGRAVQPGKAGQDAAREDQRRRVRSNF